MGADLHISPYTTADDEEAMELERRMFQGERFRLGFDRSTFRRRAENFDDHLILVGRIDGRMVATAATAFKDITLFGEKMRGAFYFDLRVDPDVRGQGIGQRIGTQIVAHGEQHSDFGYSYVVDDNQAMLGLAEKGQSNTLGSYGYLVYPTYKGLEATLIPDESSLGDVHEALCRHRDFDFYTDPRIGGSVEGWANAWLIDGPSGVAGCSAWDNRAILTEVVESLPAGLRALGAVVNTRLLQGARLPHIPRQGEHLKSWYLFDFFASTVETGRSLLRHVAQQAQQRDLDYCYVICDPDDPLIRELRRDMPKAFAPLIRYRLMGARVDRSPTPPILRPYIDIRDV